MKKLITITLTLLTLATQAQDCTLNEKVQTARKHMNEGDEGLTCANAAKFYTKLCQYKTEALNEAQSFRLKKELIAIKKAYNAYGVFCKDIGRINDVIPDRPGLNSRGDEKTSTDNIILEALSSSLEGNYSTGESSGENCNTAAGNKFGNHSFSNSGAENAANQYEAYRCHCINGTAQRQFDGATFSVNQLKNLRENYYSIKSSGDPSLSPLPTKCADSPIGERSTTTIAASNFNKTPKNLKESFIKAFNPQGYGYYQYGMSIVNRGKAIAEQIATRADHYSSIINNSDPAKVVEEFESKMTRLDDMENQLENEQSNLIVSQLEELGNQISANDYQGIQSNVFGSLSALAEMGDAKAELKKRKAKLEKERRQKYQQAYLAKYKATEPLILEFKKRAAYADNKVDEKYYLDNIDHLLAAITNTESTPPSTTSTGNSIENKFINEDVQWTNKAKYKFSKYIYETTLSGLNTFVIIDGNTISTTAASKFIPEAYLEAAISYASKAVSKNPTAKNYMLLAELYTFKKDFTALIMYQTAQKIDSSYVENYSTQLKEELSIATDMVANALKHSDNPEYNSDQLISSIKIGNKVALEMHQTKLKQIQNNAVDQIKNAIRLNNESAINALLDLNLDQSITIGNKDILTYAVSIDQADAVQLILNKYIDELSDEEKNTKLKKTIMLAITHDSAIVLSRFMELGVSMDFALNNYTPISLAKELNSENALKVLKGKNIDDEVTQSKLPVTEQQRQEALGYLEKLTEERAKGKNENELNEEALEYAKNYFLRYSGMPTSQLLALNTGSKDIGEIRTNNGGTLLHLAVNLTVQNKLNFCRTLVTTLLKNEVDFTVKDNDGKTAYDLLLEHEKALKEIAIKTHNKRKGSVKYCWKDRISDIKP